MSLEQALMQNNELLKSSISVTEKLISALNNQHNASNSNTTKSVESEAAVSSDEGKIAAKKTYIFFKETKTGAVINKGDVVPTINGATAVQKTKWESLCEKYGLDINTGQSADEPSDDDLGLDLDDDDSTADLDTEVDSIGDADADDDDLGLDLDDDGDQGTKIEDVQAALRNVGAQEGLGREISLKILNKFGCSNLNGLDKKHYDDVIRVANSQISKMKLKLKG